MASRLSVSNLVTIVRLGLVFVVVLLAYGATMWEGLLAAAVAVLIIVGDWLDGHLARRLDQATKLGSVLDITADRVLESVLWILLADLELVPIWIPIVVISRGIITDSIRGYLLQFGFSGWGQRTLHQSKIGKFITGSPIMRSGYAILKAFSFGWLLLLEGVSAFLIRRGDIPPDWIDLGFDIGWWAAVVAAIICVVRGIPVIIEGVAMIRTKEDNA